MVSKVVSLPIIGCLLLSNVASADEEESRSNLRKLDVVVSLEASRLDVSSETEGSDCRCISL